MTSVKKKLDFAQGALGVHMKREAEQTVNLVEIFSSRGVDLTGDNNI